MKQKRKETIIREIKYWKRSNLLPEQYCDFLLTLYSEGEESTDKITVRKQKVSITDIKAFYLFLTVHLFLLLTIVVIYFTNFSFLLQIFSVTMMVLFAVFIGRKTEISNQNLGQYYYLIAAIMFFLLLLSIHHQFVPDDRLLLGVIVFANVISWFLIGLIQRKNYFLIAGGVGVILSILVGLFT